MRRQFWYAYDIQAALLHIVQEAFNLIIRLVVTEVCSELREQAVATGYQVRTIREGDDGDLSFMVFIPFMIFCEHLREPSCTTLTMLQFLLKNLWIVLWETSGSQICLSFKVNRHFHEIFSLFFVALSSGIVGCSLLSSSRISIQPAANSARLADGVRILIVLMYFAYK